MLALGLVLSISCGLFQNKDLAGKAVDRFHQLFNEQSYSVIYHEADAQFHRSMTVPDFDDLLQAMQKSLGLFKQARQTGFQSSGTIATLTYESEFTRGKATEQFGYAISSGGAALVSYSITSPLLIRR